jgi:23S rRNA (adenine2503-C2)-methyltransferase
VHALQGLTPEGLVAQFPELTLAEARKVMSTVVRHGGAALARPVEQVRRAALEAVRARGHVPTLGLLAERASAVDPFVKYLLETADGERVEAVRIPLERPGRFSVCVSSQVGCALACAFCATGRLGLQRNLDVWEIVEQVRIVRGHLPPGGRVHGVVFQGMGEPLSNAERVLEAIRVLTEPSGLAVDARAITVCTSGLPAGIRRLALEAPKVRLGLSLASARPTVRRSLMPIDAAHALEVAVEAAAFHAETTGLSPLFAVTLLAGKNDTADDARALAALVHAFAARTGRRPRLSIIPYNAIASVDDPFTRSSDAAEDAFRAVLRELGVFTHKRYSGGGDVGAACGQLAGRGDPAGVVDGEPG